MADLTFLQDDLPPVPTADPQRPANVAGVVRFAAHLAFHGDLDLLSEWLDSIEAHDQMTNDLRQLDTFMEQQEADL